MKKGCIIGLATLVGIVLILAISAGIGWSNYKKVVSFDERIDAKYVSNKSDYDNMWKKFKELVQVSDLQADHYKEIYSGLIQGRYEDPNLLFKMVKEDNPKLDGAVYTQMQREISAGRNQFNNNQSALADIIREYNTFIRTKVILKIITGRERLDPNKFIVTSEKTTKAFDTGKDDVINLRDK